jgi:hypothetical protein
MQKFCEKYKCEYYALKIFKIYYSYICKKKEKQ